MPGGVHALADRATPEFAAQEIRKIAAECRQAASLLPRHADFILDYCKSAAPEMAAG
jgi:hypothetical protein